MAGEVLASAVLKTLVEKLISASVQEFEFYRGFEGALVKLEKTLDSVQPVLQDAEMQQSKSTFIQNWLLELKDAAYDAEDILEDTKIGSRPGSGKSCICLTTPSGFSSKMAHKMQNIQKKLDDIASRKSELADHGVVVGNRYGVTPGTRKTHSLVTESKIWGRVEEAEIIMEKLLDTALDQHDLSVYAIWGMGGLGKTTLAKEVFNDERTQKHFCLLIWVCVSDDFRIQRLVRAILEAIDGSSCGLSELDPLLRHLREKLTGKKFLLVLDDVWNEKCSLWNDLKAILTCDSKGSLVLVTTRNQTIASMMATVGVRKIACLSEDDSWSLFKQGAFPTGKVNEKLVSIGKKILGKCGGVPLAIKALGSLMGSKTQESEWIAIEESEFWRLVNDDNGILHVLKLSYYNLQPHMRQCFAYCCIFPKDYRMKVDELIQLWLANDLIPSDGQRDLLLEGRLIFKELVWRSFFQDVQENWEGRMVCKMHDLMHDLAVSVMRHETYIVEEHEKKLEIPKTIRHLSCHVQSETSHTIKLPSCNSLRSVIVHQDRGDTHVEDFYTLLSNQQYLRALDVSQYLDKISPGLVCKFKHLKYLVMLCSDMERLPKSLTRLQNIQTLKLTSSYNLLELPNDLKVMKNLWFLEMDNHDSLLCMPPGLGELTSLRTLGIFIVGRDVSQQLVQLKDLNKLEGGLPIKGLKNVRNLKDAESSNLTAKENLASLSLYWTEDHENKPPQHFEEVLEGLKPHRNLERLFIECYYGSKFPNWMGSSTFENMKEIDLKQCERCEYLPSLGNLPSLTTLSMRGMNCVRKLGKEWLGDGECPFPALTSLKICGMSNLEEWSIPDSLKCFPCLIDLLMVGCPKLDKFPFLPALRKLFLVCSDEVDVLPDDMFRDCKALEDLTVHGPCIRRVPNMWDTLSSLKRLEFFACYKLEGYPEGLNTLHSLENLSLCDCDSLPTFPAIILEGLCSLKSLSFLRCKILKPLSGRLNKGSPLDSLRIIQLPELECLPESIQQLSALRKLQIRECEGLLSLPDWLSCLQSLSILEIEYCKNLESLPHSFTSLKSMRYLYLLGCPQLEKRCEKPKGEDWQKISHIPSIDIDGKIVQRLDQKDIC